MSESRKNTLRFLLLMCVFGCIGPLVRAVGLPSPVTACLRAWVSSAALIVYFILTKKKFTRADLGGSLLPMILSGVLIATDWIGLFASYNYTTIAVATVCYYVVPILILLASPLVLGERFTKKHLFCSLGAFAGLICISGVLTGGFRSGSLLGPAFALFGAVSYAGVILLNKKYPSGDPMLRTTIQLAAAAAATTPYVLLTCDVTTLHLTLTGLAALLLLGIGLTAVTYVLYFDLVVKNPARTVAILSYADPAVAVIISVVFLSEPMTLFGLLGTVLIIGSAMISELV